MTDDVDESEIERLIGAMTLDEKASLTAGANMWYLPPVERLGIPALKVSDGPSGVRGESLTGRRSLSLPWRYLAISEPTAAAMNASQAQLPAAHSGPSRL